MNGRESNSPKRRPYPGLRSFRRCDADIFFGREDHVEALLGLLQQHRFVAVIGSSGCGKSSLVQAGLIPELEQGFMEGAGEAWRVASMRPGNSPIDNLRDAMATETVLGRRQGGGLSDSEFIRAALARGPLGLVDLVRRAPAMNGKNLLVLVDQFEELFRYCRDFDASQAFVNLLLRSAQQKQTPIYTVVTMRSDFLGDCSQFSGLPEAMNQAQFLTPRLSRNQCRATIVGPAEECDAEIDEGLVNRILNEIGTDPDQLPLMQHALMRTWLHAVDQASQNGGPSGPIHIRLENYLAVGGMREALARHVNGAFGELADDEQRVAEVLFRRLVEGTGAAATRHPVTFDEARRVTRVEPDVLKRVVDIFRRPGRNFLTPGLDDVLTPNTVLDISHESLIRQWDKLTAWAEAEARSAEQYQRLLQTAKRWDKGKANLWRSTELQIARQWRNNDKPNAEWAKRYGDQEQYKDDFELCEQFLNKSVNAERLRRLLRYSLVAAAVGLFIGGFLIYQELSQTAAENLEIKQARDEALRSQREATLSAYSLTLSRVQDRWQSDPDTASELLSACLPELKEFTWRFFNRLVRLRPPSYEAHQGPVNSVVFSPDGRFFASGGDDGAVRIWDRREGGGSTDLGAHDDRVLSLAFAADRNILVSAGVDDNIKVWDLDDGADALRALESATREIPVNSSIRSVAFAPSGTTLAAAGEDGTITLWDISTGQRTGTLATHGDWVACVVFSPDGSMIASANYDGTVRIWKATTGQLVKEFFGHASSVTSAAFSPDGRLLASADSHGSILLWDTTSKTQAGRPIKAHDNLINCLAFSVDGTRLASASDDHTVKLWDTKTWSNPTLLCRDSGPIYFVSYSRDGSSIASAHSDGKIQIRDARAPSMYGPDMIHEHAKSIAFIPDSGATLVYLTYDGTVSLWDTEAGSVSDSIARDVPGAQISAVGIDRSSRSFFVAQGRRLRLWDLAQGGERANTEWDVERYTEPDDEALNAALITTVAVSADGKTLAAGDQRGEIALWDIDTAGLTHRKNLATPQRGPVTCLAFAPRSTSVLASVGDDQRIILWDAKTGEMRNRLPKDGEVQFLAFGALSIPPQGLKLQRQFELLVSTDGYGNVRLWDVATGRQRGEPLRHATNVAVTCAAFTQDGKTLATGGMDRNIMLWDPETGDLRATLVGHSSGVLSVAFHEDWLLASAGADGIRLWLATDVPAE